MKNSRFGRLAVAGCASLGLVLTMGGPAFGVDDPATPNDPPTAEETLTPTPADDTDVADEETDTVDADVQQVAAVSDYLELSLVRTDQWADSTEVHVGDRLTFELTYTNVSDETITVYPRSSNLDAAAVEGQVGNCRYGDLAPGATATCALPFLVLTDEHASDETFVPEIVIDVTRDRDGTDIVAEGESVTSAELTVDAEPRADEPDPSEIPADRPEGRPLTLVRPGDGGFQCHRIPALTTATNGWILASWDGRPNNCGDSPQPNSIVQRISKDGGRSWEPLQVVAHGSIDDPTHGYSDPSYVVDRETGDIFLFFVKSFDQGLHGSHPGVDPEDRNVQHAAVMKSSDNGETWTEPWVITAEITDDVEHYVSRFAASGEGIQLRQGEHAGRLIQQFTYKVIDDGVDVFKAVSVYSDDHGETWQAGQPFGAGMDENKVVELSDGRLMVNSRASGHGADFVNARRVAISEDGGSTYGEVTVDETLVDPANNAGLTRAFPDADPEDPRSKIILFTNTFNPGARTNGTVHVSFDDGQTWSGHKEFFADHTGYSTITPLPDENGSLDTGTYGILFETPSAGLSYMPISFDWLEVLPLAVTGVDREVYRGGNILDFTVSNVGDETISGAMLNLDLPEGWEIVDPTVPLSEDADHSGFADGVVVPDIAPGGTAEVSVKVRIPDDQPSGDIDIPAIVSLGDDSARGSITLTVGLEADQQDPRCLAASVPEDLPEEIVNEATGADNMFDGNPNSIWHTPWDETVVPLDVDFTFDYSDDVTTFDLTNRLNGVNGAVRAGEFFLVQGDELISLGEFTMEDTYSLDLAELATYVEDGDTVTLRVAVTQTDGNETNTWVSLAEACFFVPATGAGVHDEVLASPIDDEVVIVDPVEPEDPVDPDPVDPDPADPVDPDPTDPDPVDPDPVDPSPADPADPGQPDPGQPGDEDADKAQPGAGPSKRDGSLAKTGASVAGLALLATGLLAGGAALRRRHG